MEGALVAALAAPAEGTLALAVLAGAAAAGLLAHAVAKAVALRIARRPESALATSFVRSIARPARLLVPLLVVRAALPAAALGDGVRELTQHGLAIGLILGVAWLFVGAVQGVEELVLARHRVDVQDNLAARRMHTQLRLLTRLLDVVVVFVAIAAVLMTFPRVRQLGAGLLASAGIAGIVVGFATRPVLTNVIAGLQIALAAPIRLDDVVIVEGEWGRIEEITATYVVVAIWDDRRLVVPLSWFLEQPFQNWTRKTAQLLGTVFLSVDYATPLDALREELQRLCERSLRWDRRVCLLQVTDCKPTVLEVRALVSARDSGSLWDLRCEVREGLVAYLAREHPGCLPRVRAEIEGLEAVEGPAAASES